MPPHPRATSSPKRMKAKCKVAESGIPALTGQGKKVRTADEVGLVSLQLSSDVNALPIRRSGHPGAGTGGRNAQLEKVGAALHTLLLQNHVERAVAAVHSVSNGMGSTITSSCQKGKKAKTSSVPDPQAELDITRSESSYQSLQPGLSLCEMGRHFGFQMPQGSPPIVPPGTEPDLQALNNSYVVIMMAKKDAKYRACSAVQSLAGGHQSSSSSGESGTGDKDNDYSTDSDNAGEREFGWAEVGFSREPEPSPVHVTSTLAPDFDFQYSRDEDDMNTKQTLAFDKPSSNEIASEGARRVPEVSELELGGSQEPDGSQWDTAGKQFEPVHVYLTQVPDYWPIHKPDMAKLLYEDLSTWRSELKKNVTVIASIMPGLVPPSNIPPQERASWVEGAATELKVGSKFLRDGMDEQGKTRNFANPALCDAVIMFMYTGPYRIARRHPDIFSKQLPLSCLALVSAVFVCVLNSLAKNGNGKSSLKFTTKEYRPTYTSALKLLQNIMEHPYHGPKLVEQLQSWAEAGWQGYALVSNKSSTLTVFMQGSILQS
ncbi:uncharacterized protein EDB91DRAFT_1077292 [Suillus paluster]|uniref:uncharacterized protein n=1 Tax=Suillus paluster TaxID=48578 RepID=UPI001B872CA0|nr:uncharacterized protein EDB91DRAFT_1077292 [Suillus paluster]KAG1753546.1 hypothetical protein EDB91DRAFT_1077292 [Suillus paluster]